MTFFTLIFKNLLRRRSRSLLTTIGIAIGIAAVVALTSLAWGFQRSWSNVFKARGSDLIVTKTNTHSPMPAPFSAAIKAELAAMPRVREAAGVLCEIFSVEDSPSMVVAGWEPGTSLWSHLKFVKGRMPDAASKNMAAIGIITAETLRKSVGDTIQIETTEFTVSGIYSSEAFAENAGIVLPLDAMQALIDQQGMVNLVDIWLDAGVTEEDVAAFRDAINQKFKGLTAFSPQGVSESNAGIQIAKAMSLAMSLIALLVGAVGVMNTILMSVFERIEEIGVLLAIGWRRARILRMILMESFLLSFVGGVSGCGLGVLATWAIQSTPWIRGKIEGDVTLPLLGTSLLIALAVGAFGGIYPAWIGSRMSPAAALRHA